jgi:Polysaccharide deacetylase
MAGIKPGKLLLFWDYDTQWGCDRSRTGNLSKWGHLEFEHTEYLLDVHAQFGVPSCFAVVGAAALEGDRPYHDPMQIRRIHEAGHEVASHSFRHEWLPGLDRPGLKETLQKSKDALEQCIGAPVGTFVPPFNQPFDYPAGFSFSLSERREAAGDRSDLRLLCEALREIGYRFCRVAYRPMSTRLAEWVFDRRLDRPSKLETIAGVTCVRLNTPGGFGRGALNMLDKCANSGRLVVVYGHPHSVGGRGPQGKASLVPFLQRAAQLQREGAIRICRPRELDPAA